MPSTTADGYTWTLEGGLKSGKLVSSGVIEPPAKTRQDVGEFLYDCVVVGAGYAGLSSARDLVTAGRSVLLLEARDRIGGRTYSVMEDGFVFEMGGTWIYHTQGHTWRELMRYGLDGDFAMTPQRGHENDYYGINFEGCQPRTLSHEEAGKLSAKAWHVFINIDGEGGRRICPLPHAQLGNLRVDRAEIEKWDSYSCWDRFQEIKDSLTAEEQGLLLSMLLIISGGESSLRTSALWDIIRAHALNGYEFQNLDEIWFTYKLRAGQSELARRMFEDAASFGLEYMFETPVAAIKQTQNAVELHTKSGSVVKARKVICTIPLNVLKNIQFEPTLSALRQEAVNAGHINYLTKIHAVVKGSGLASFSGSCFPNNLLTVAGDGLLPSGDTHLVAFGTDERPNFVPEKHPEKIVEALKNFHPMEVKKLIFHNWDDEYSQGGPAWWPPQYMTRYQEELQKRDGNVFFANADWAHGWRAFIDGALEQGFMNSLTVLKELRQDDKH